MQSCLAKEHLATEIEESVPMDRVLSELRAKYPDVPFPDNFDVGVRMHRFWDEGANNESAAYVMEGGIYCHTGEEGFKPWGNSDLLGPDFMREFEVQKTGVIIDEFWYDGSNYISRNPRTDGWLIESEKNTILNIAARYGLLKCPSKKGELSPIERLLFEVQMTQRVKAYAKFIHLPEGLLEFQGDQYINISQVKAMSPSGMEGEWGEHFPFLAKFIDGLMVDDTQRLILLAWWKRFYTGALKQRPNRGQIMIIAGPPACGKTLLNTKMLAPSVGGGIDAADYYINGADFSGSFYDYPLHMVDDGEPGRRHDAQKRMAGRYKKTAASDSLSVNQKFEKIKQIQWLGRVCTTMNSDPESMKQMPELQHTLEDKVIILRANEPNGLLEQTKQINKVVDEELPHLLQWLLDWDPPKEVVGGARYGVISYCDTELREEMDQGSGDQVFTELLHTYLTELKCSDGYHDKETVELRTSDLYEALAQCELIKVNMREFKAVRIGHILTRMMLDGYPITKRRLKSGSYWSIRFDLHKEVEDGGT
jgi:hypothetical protein